MRKISLEGVSVRFGDVAALSDVTIEIEAGEQLAVIGASGAGKSTLFATLTRSVALRNGRVTVGGRDLYELSRKELRSARRAIGTIHQAYNRVPQLPAGTNAALGEVVEMGRLRTLRAFLAGPDAGLFRKVQTALEEVELGDRAGTRTADLSGGQQQRVAVARLLVQRPGVVLADEPVAAVDPVTTEKVLETLLKMNRDGATLLINLHDVEIARRFPRVVALREGRVVFDGSPGELDREKLAGIYAGDPEPREQVRPESSRRDPVSLVEGRDGVSAH